MHMYLEFLDERFWVAVSFVIFAFLMKKTFNKNIIGELDKKKDEIKSLLCDAEKLKIEAKANLDKQIELKNQIEREIESILDKANKQIEIIHENSKKDISDLILIKEKILENKLNDQKKKLQESILQEIIEKSIEKVSKRLENEVSDVFKISSIKDSDLQKLFL